MPKWKTVKGKPFDEEKWSKAKLLAEKQGRGGDYPYIVGIYKRMTGVSTSKPDSTSKEIKKSFRLIIGGDLDEFRCPDCHALLLKGKNLEKSLVEIKCRKCGAIVSNH